MNVTCAFVNIKATKQRLVLQRCTESEAEKAQWPTSALKGVPTKFWQSSASGAFLFWPTPDESLCSVELVEKAL